MVLRAGRILKWRIERGICIQTVGVIKEKRNTWAPYIVDTDPT